MKALIQKIMLFPILFLGCDSINEIETKRYIDGDVSFALKDSVSFEEMIDTIFSFGEIYQIKFSVTKHSEFPEDSLNYIKSTLRQHNFIDTLTVIKYDTIQNYWTFHLWIRGFMEENINDWYGLQNKLGIYPTSTYFAYGLLKVEPGKEKYWINILLESGLFKWADYNYIADIVPH